MIRRYEKETVFAPGEAAPACHASTVLPLADGSVLAAWFGGRHEKAADVCIWLSRRAPDGGWSAPRPLTPDNGVPDWNPVLHLRLDGTVLLFYKHGEEIPDWVTYMLESRDGGETWSDPRPLVPGDDSGGRGPVKNKCLRLKSGALLAPASTERGGRWIPFIDRSYDDGTTWTASAPMERVKYQGRWVGLIQPTLWEDADGAVHALMRSDKGAVYRSDSEDGGVTWSRPRRTRLPNNNSGIDCAKDGAGRIWLLSNPVAENWGVRHPLALSVSQDNGRHFKTILLPEPGNGEFSYPSVVYENGVLHAVYTWNRKQIRYIRIESEA